MVINDDNNHFSLNGLSRAQWPYYLRRQQIKSNVGFR